MQIHRRTLALAPLALVLAACSGNKEGEAIPAATSASSATSATPAASDGGVDEVGDEVEDSSSTLRKFTGKAEGGVTYAIDLAATPPTDIEAYRKATAQDEVGYIKVDIDNSAGSQEASPIAMTVVDENGTELSYTDVSTAISDWGPIMRDDGPKDKNDGYYYETAGGEKLSEAEFDKLNTQGVDLGNKYLEASAAPHAKKTVWFLGPKIPAKTLYVEVSDTQGQVPGDPA